MRWSTALMVASCAALTVRCGTPTPSLVGAVFACTHSTQCADGQHCVDGSCVSLDITSLDGGTDAGLGGGTGGGLGTGGGGGTTPTGGGTGGGSPTGGGSGSTGGGTGGGSGSIDAGPPLVTLSSDLAACSDAGWCWVNPQPFGFGGCTGLSWPSDSVAYASFDSKLFRISGSRFERVVIPGVSRVSYSLATDDDAGWFTTFGDQGHVYRFTLGQPVVSYALTPSVPPYQFIQSPGGSLWATDLYGTQSRFNPTSNAWTNVPKPPGTLHAMTATVGNEDQLYSVFWGSPSENSPHFFYADGGWSLVGDGGIECLWADPNGRFLARGGDLALSALHPSGRQLLAPQAPGCPGALVNDEVYSYGQTGLYRLRQGAWDTIIPREQVGSGLSRLSMRDTHGLTCGPNVLLGTSDGHTWQSLLQHDAGIFGSDAPDQMVVLDDGTVLATYAQRVFLFDGRSVSQLPGITTARRVAPIGQGDLLVVSANTVRRYTSGTLGPAMPASFTWSQVSITDVVVESPTSAWATGATVAGAGRLFHWDGTTWDEAPLPFTSATAFQQIVRSERSMWMVGNNRAYWRDSDGGWSDIGGTTQGLGLIAASGDEELMTCLQGGLQSWTPATGWRALTTDRCLSLAADPATNVVVYVQANDDQVVHVRSTTRAWGEHRLPGYPGQEYELKVSMRGGAMWLFGPNGTVMRRQ
ncbi:MAG: hypothetical protein JNG84_14035 [Archangium sp.]|nr:hypothetical protein [Archangium sp.]